MSDISDIRSDIGEIKGSLGGLTTWCQQHDARHDRAEKHGIGGVLARLSLRDIIFTVALLASLFLGGTAITTGDNGTAESVARVAQQIESLSKLVEDLSTEEATQ